MYRKVFWSIDWPRWSVIQSKEQNKVQYQDNRITPVTLVRIMNKLGSDSAKLYAGNQEKMLDDIQIMVPHMNLINLIKLFE